MASIEYRWDEGIWGKGLRYPYFIRCTSSGGGCFQFLRLSSMNEII